MAILDSHDDVKILVLNTGSSSLKSCLYSVQESDEWLDSLVWQAHIDWSDPANTELRVETKDHPATTQKLSSSGFDDALAKVFESLWSGDNAPISSAEEVAIVGHRVVHGGTKYLQPTEIDNTLISELRKLIELAPSHEPGNIKGIEASQKTFRSAKQLAVFDTAFHATMPESSYIYACPYDWYTEHSIRRFGFHGISHQYCANQAAKLLDKEVKDLRIITCHLGGGASLCAILNGQSQMNTMGYTPMDGLVMGTRCGEIDPGIILHMLQHKLLTLEQIGVALNKQSGIKGISGQTSDMRELERLMSSGNSRAKLAFDIYVQRLSAQIASLVPLLGGLDVLVFTGGVGQNSDLVRSATCAQLGFLGVNIEADKNQDCKVDTNISAANSTVNTIVIHTKEELAIARECLQFLNSAKN